GDRRFSRWALPVGPAGAKSLRPEPRTPDHHDTSPGPPILQFEDALVAAQLAGDVAALDQLLDDALHFTGLGGQVFSKADDLAAHRSGALRITRMQALDRHLTLLGSTVVVSALMDAEATVGGVVHASRLRYTR